MASQPQCTFTVSGKPFTFTFTTDYIAFNENGAMGFIKHTFNIFLTTEVRPVGRGSRAIRSARPSIVLRKHRYQVAYCVTFRGTSGYFYSGNKRRQYIRPISSQARALAIAVALARELSRQGRLLTVLVRVHETGATYYIKGLQYWVRKANGNGQPEVRLYPATQKVNGLRKHKDYTFDLIIAYTSEPLTSRAKATFKELAQHLIRSLKPESEAPEKEARALSYWLARNG